VHPANAAYLASAAAFSGLSSTFIVRGRCADSEHPLRGKSRRKTDSCLSFDLQEFSEPFWHFVELRIELYLALTMSRFGMWILFHSQVFNLVDSILLHAHSGSTLEPLHRRVRQVNHPKPCLVGKRTTSSSHSSFEPRNSSQNWLTSDFAGVNSSLTFDQISTVGFGFQASPLWLDSLADITVL